MNKKYRVHLTPEQRATLEEHIRTGAAPALTQRHARILLKADTAEGGPAWRDRQIAAAVEVSVVMATSVIRSSSGPFARNQAARRYA